MRPRHRLTRVACLFAATCLAAPVLAGQSSELFLVDFEGLEESTPLSDQYAGLGVIFSVPGSEDLLPIVCVEGNPVTGFTGSGSDRPMSSGTGGLTDPLIGGDNAIFSPVQMDFDPPVTSVRFFVIDIDGSDQFTATAFADGVEVDVRSLGVGDPGTGNGVSTEFQLIAADPEIGIDRVVLEATSPDPTGWGLDFLTFTRPCEGAACGPGLEIAQESAPGAGDFDDNVLGLLVAFPSNAPAASFYGYGVPEGSSWNGPLTARADVSHLLLANLDEGLSIVWVHDRAIPDDPDGGRAETRVEVSDDADGLERTVEDDPGEASGYVGEPGDTVFTARHTWSPCCTDGVVYSGLDCNATAIVEFTDVDGNPGNDTIDGLSEWIAFSADGTEIPLALEADRRVRIRVVPDPTCPWDLTCDALVGAADLLLLLGSWGDCTPGENCPADIDDDGSVGTTDLLALLSNWGPCP